MAPRSSRCGSSSLGLAARRPARRCRKAPSAAHQPSLRPPPSPQAPTNGWHLRLSQPLNPVCLGHLRPRQLRRPRQGTSQRPNGWHLPLPLPHPPRHLRKGPSPLQNRRPSSPSPPLRPSGWHLLLQCRHLLQCRNPRSRTDGWHLRLHLRLQHLSRHLRRSRPRLRKRRRCRRSRRSPRQSPRRRRPRRQLDPPRSHRPAPKVHPNPRHPPQPPLGRQTRPLTRPSRPRLGSPLPRPGPASQSPCRSRHPNRRPGSCHPHRRPKRPPRPRPRLLARSHPCYRHPRTPARR